MYAMHLLKARDEYIMAKVEAKTKESAPEPKPEAEEAETAPSEVMTTPAPTEAIEAE